MQKYNLPTDMHIREDYRVFPLDIENDPHILFHGTALENFEPIKSEGFKRGIDVGAKLESISYAKGSVGALTHWVSRRKKEQHGIILAVRFKNLQPLTEEVDFVYDYKQKPTQPEIVGYVEIPATYCHG